MSVRTWTSLELLRWTAGYFREHGVSSPRLDAELLLAHALDMKRIDLYLEFERPVGAAGRDRFRELVRRRARDRVPVAYLTGVREFWSKSFGVTEDVLIPRPETETLVRVAAELTPSNVAEIGVGSGAVCGSLASELPDARFVAVDCSAAALRVARRNLESLGSADRVQLVRGDGLGALAGPFDLIVSNPPYVPTRELDKLAPEIQHEPRLALDGGPDGLELIRQLAEAAPRALAAGGRLVLEIGQDQAPRVAELLRGVGAGEIRAHEDLAGVERVVSARFERERARGEA